MTRRRTGYLKQVGVRLTRPDVRKLDQLCDSLGSTISQVVRDLIREAPLPSPHPAPEEPGRPGYHHV